MYNKCLDMIGNGPIIELNEIKKKYGFEGKLYAKYEGYNLTGSIKDKAVINIIKDLEAKDILKKGMTIVEATSGNTGISLSLIGRIMGYNVIIVMPANMSFARRKLIERFGARLILTNKEEGMSGAINKAIELSKNNNTILFNQFKRYANVEAHIKMTAQEIDRELQGKIDVIICGIGSAGTIMGISKYYKNNPHIKIVGVEPKSSPIISKGLLGKHNIQGIGAGFYPPLLDMNLINDIITVSDEDAYACSEDLLNYEGLFVGPSSGAALAASLKYKNDGLRVLVILPDNGYRYLE